MAEPKREAVIFVDIPLSAPEMRLLRRNLSPDPQFPDDPGRMRTRSGVSVWAIESYHRALGIDKVVARQFEVPVREVRASRIWAEVYQDDIDRRIQDNDQAGGWSPRLIK